MKRHGIHATIGCVVLATLTAAGRRQLVKETTKWKRLATAIGRILGPEAEES